MPRICITVAGASANPGASRGLHVACLPRLVQQQRELSSPARPQAISVVKVEKQQPQHCGIFKSEDVFAFFSACPREAIRSTPTAGEWGKSAGYDPSKRVTVSWEQSLPRRSPHPIIVNSRVHHHSANSRQLPPLILRSHPSLGRLDGARSANLGLTHPYLHR